MADSEQSAGSFKLTCKEMAVSYLTADSSLKIGPNSFTSNATFDMASKANCGRQDHLAWAAKRRSRIQASL
jgi:hypothetical protein